LLKIRFRFPCEWVPKIRMPPSIMTSCSTFRYMLRSRLMRSCSAWSAEYCQRVEKQTILRIAKSLQGMVDTRKLQHTMGAIRCRCGNIGLFIVHQCTHFCLLRPFKTTRHHTLMPQQTIFVTVLLCSNNGFVKLGSLEDTKTISLVILVLLTTTWILS
jgi:hypothetical protein